MSNAFEAVVIGTSAGGMDALITVLSVLPERYALPVMVVVHLPSDKKSVITELLQLKCKAKVQEALDKEPIKDGVIYFAPPDYHLLVEAEKYLSLSNEEPVLFSRPSIDVLFESAADAYGENLLGIILTGASSDGAKGLKAVAQAGGTTLVQNPASSYATAMPQAALEACPGAQVLSLENIAAYLKEAAHV